MIKQLGFILVSCFCLANVAQAELQISKLSDFTLAEADMHNTNRITNALCVYSTDPTQLNYNVQIFSSAEGGRFEMCNGVSTLRYQVRWSATGGNSYEDIQPHQPKTGIASTQPNCNNVNMQIVIPPENLVGVTSGEYQTALNILISPT